MGRHTVARVTPEVRAAILGLARADLTRPDSQIARMTGVHGATVGRIIRTDKQLLRLRQTVRRGAPDDAVRRAWLKRDLLIVERARDVKLPDAALGREFGLTQQFVNRIVLRTNPLVHGLRQMIARYGASPLRVNESWLRHLVERQSAGLSPREFMAVSMLNRIDVTVDEVALTTGMNMPHVLDVVHRALEAVRPVFAGKYPSRRDQSQRRRESGGASKRRAT